MSTVSLCCSAVGLPIHLHTLLPTLTVESTIGAHMYQGVQAGSRAHLHCRKDVYQHAGIWLRVFSDYDGFYDGCDEWAMKVRLAAPVFPLLSCWTYPTRPAATALCSSRAVQRIRSRPRVRVLLVAVVVRTVRAAPLFPAPCGHIVAPLCDRGCTNCAVLLLLSC